MTAHLHHEVVFTRGDCAVQHDRTLFVWRGWEPSADLAMARAQRAFRKAYDVMVVAHRVRNFPLPAKIAKATAEVRRKEPDNTGIGIGTDWTIMRSMTQITGGLTSSETFDARLDKSVDALTAILGGIDPRIGSLLVCSEDGSATEAITVSYDAGGEVGDDLRPMRNLIDDVLIALALRVREANRSAREQGVVQILHEQPQSATLRAAEAMRARERFKRVPKLLGKLEIPNFSDEAAQLRAMLRPPRRKAAKVAAC